LGWFLFFEWNFLVYMRRRMDVKPPIREVKSSSESTTTKLLMMDRASPPNTPKLLRSSQKLREEKPLITEPQKQNVFTMHKYEDLPGWLQDNHFILSGYRVNFSCSLCMKSLFHKHNETWCIWTHLIGFLIFFVMAFITPIFLLEAPNAMDKLIFSVFLVCAQFQMLFSTLYHTFCCHSPEVYKWFAKLDYSGISVMIVGSYYPPLYYGFKCFPIWRDVYLSAITFLGVIGIIVSCIPIFASPRFRVTRTVFFVVFGCFALVPVPHLWAMNGLHHFWPIVVGEFYMGALYLVGAIFYSTRVPERYFPGKFDFGISSHVIWHFLTIAAALAQLWTCLKCYDIFKKDITCTQ